MVKENSIYSFVSYLIAAVWIINGLFCKVLNMVPRHQQIVGRILGDEHAVMFTKFIGVAEIGIAVWILNGFRRRWNVATQIAVIAAMNILEFVLAPDLLLWGKWNAFFAFLFILLIYYNEFYLHKTVAQQA